MIEKIYKILFILLCIANTNCSGQINNSGEIDKLKNNGPNILYLKLNTKDDNYGDLKFYNLATEKEVKIIGPIHEFLNPKIINKNNDIMCFNDFAVHKGVFFILSIKEDKSKAISIFKRLQHVNVSDRIFSYDLCDDNIIIFGYRDGIYTYNVSSDSLYLLRSIPGKLIGKLIYNQKNKYIAFSYSNTLDQLFANYLGIYKIKEDSVLLTKIEVESFGNFSPSGKRIIFGKFGDTSGVYNIDKSTYKYYVFRDDKIEGNLISPNFIDENTILLENHIPDKLKLGNYLLYDLNGLRIIKKLDLDGEFVKDKMIIY